MLSSSDWILCVHIKYCFVKGIPTLIANEINTRQQNAYKLEKPIGANEKRHGEYLASCQSVAPSDREISFRVSPHRPRRFLKPNYEDQQFSFSGREKQGDEKRKEERKKRRTARRVEYCWDVACWLAWNPILVRQSRSSLIWQQATVKVNDYFGPWYLICVKTFGVRLTLQIQKLKNKKQINTHHSGKTQYNAMKKNPVESKDYRCEAFLVVRPQLSSPNPNFSKPRTRTENSDFSSW
jgi:hypothetical protein